MALFAFGLLFNIQQAVLCLPVLLFVWTTAEPARRTRDVLRGIGILLVIGAIPYIMLPLLSDAVPSLRDYPSWLTDHPNEGALRHLSPGVEGGLRGLSGLLSLFVNSDGATSGVKLLLRGDASGLSNPLLLLRLLVALLVGVFLVVLAVRGSRGNVGLAATCWLAILCIWLFGIFWLGSDPQFWLPAYPFLLILAARGAAHIHDRRNRAIVPWGTACIAALMLAVNLPVKAPSLLFPDGGWEYQHAVAAAEQFDAGMLVITVSGEWTGYLRQLRPDGKYIDLTKMTSAAGGVCFEELADRVNQALQGNRRVFIEDVHGPLRPERTGPWKVLHTLCDLNREELRKKLSAEYRVIPAPGFEKIGLVEVRTIQAGH